MVRKKRGEFKNKIVNLQEKSLLFFKSKVIILQEKKSKYYEGKKDQILVSRFKGHSNPLLHNQGQIKLSKAVPFGTSATHSSHHRHRHLAKNLQETVKL